MSAANVRERAERIVVEHLGVEPEKVTDDAQFIDDLGADSLDIVELVMAFEDEFRIEIEDTDAEKHFASGTFGSVVRFVEKAQA